MPPLYLQKLKEIKGNISLAAAWRGHSAREGERQHSLEFEEGL